jgi:hypothetical protein
VSAPRPGGRSSVVSSAARSNAAVIPSDRQVAVRLLGAPVHLCIGSLGRLQPLLESAPALELQLSTPGIPLVREAGELRLSRVLMRSPCHCTCLRHSSIRAHPYRAHPSRSLSCCAQCRPSSATQSMKALQARATAAADQGQSVAYLCAASRSSGRPPRSKWACAST